MSQSVEYGGMQTNTRSIQTAFGAGHQGLFLFFSEHQLHSDDCKQQGLHEIHFPRGPGVIREQPSGLMGEQTDRTKHEKGLRDKDAAEHCHLEGGGAGTGVDELRQKGEKKERYFRIEQVHDDSFSIQAEVGGSAVLRHVEAGLFPVAECFPGEVKQVQGAGVFHDRKRERGLIDDSGNPGCRGRHMYKKPGAESERCYHTGFCVLCYALRGDK